MLYAKKVDFENHPSLVIENPFNNFKVTKIEVYNEEYEDHTEMIIIPYNEDTQLGKFWNCPCCVYYI